MRKLSNPLFSTKDPLSQVETTWMRSWVNKTFPTFVTSPLYRDKVLSPAAHSTWRFITSKRVHSRFLKISAAAPPWMLLSPNPQHCTHLYLAQAQKWLSCHWRSCSSTSSLETGVGILGSQSLPLLPRWAWSPHSSDRSVAAWVRVLGCSHRGWAESPGRNTGDQLPRTWEKRNTRKKRCCQSGFHLCTWFARMRTENQHLRFLCIPLPRKHPFHSHPSPKQHQLSWVPYWPNKASNSAFNIFSFLHPLKTLIHHCAASSQRGSAHTASLLCNQGVKPTFLSLKTKHTCKRKGRFYRKFQQLMNPRN